MAQNERSAKGLMALPTPPVEAELDSMAGLILRALPATLIVVDPDFRIRTVNEATLELLGYREDDLVGKPMAAIMGSPRQAVAGLTTMAELLFDDSARTIELTYYARDGRPVPVTFSSALLRDANGTGAILCAAQPIPDLETAGAADREAVAQVRARILGNVSHEIRTPLHAVLGMAELLLGTELSDDQRDYVETIVQSSRAMAGSLRDLIDFGHGDTRSAALDRADFDLEACVDEAVKHVTAAAAEKNLPLAVRVDPDVPRTLRGDAIRLRQVLTHLLDNAVRFADRGSIEVRVERDVDLSPFEDAPREIRLRFRVRDEGPGIAPATLKAVFEPFRRGDGQPAEAGGLGLGLAISRRLVDLMGGRIWARSRPAEGATFFFTARFDPPSSRLNDVSLLGALDDADPGFLDAHPVKDRRLSVLLAEDNPTHQRVLHRFLERWGHRVKATVNGIGALEGWETGEYDLLLLDTDMPGIDGVTAAETIRRSDRDAARRTPIIALAGAGTAEERSRCLAAGMDLVLRKPVEAGELRRAIAALTGGR